jgi:hypothetical protein
VWTRWLFILHLLSRLNRVFCLHCDAPVQLIDATDTVTISKSRDLWTATSPQDDEPARFFDNLASSQSRLREWCSMLETRWVHHDWSTVWTQDSEVRDDLRPEEIWRGSPPHRPLARTRQQVFFSEELFKHSDEDVQPLFPNKEHPFVLESIAAMPRKKECHVSRRGEDEGLERGPHLFVPSSALTSFLLNYLFLPIPHNVPRTAETIESRLLSRQTPCQQ